MNNNRGRNAVDNARDFQSLLGQHVVSADGEEPADQRRLF